MLKKIEIFFYQYTEDFKEKQGQKTGTEKRHAFVSHETNLLFL